MNTDVRAAPVLAALTAPSVPTPPSAPHRTTAPVHPSAHCVTAALVIVLKGLRKQVPGAPGATSGEGSAASAAESKQPVAA